MATLESLDEKIDNLVEKLDEVGYTLNPLSRPCVRNSPLVNPGARDLMTTDKNGVFTWFQFPNGKPVLIGSAHTGLRYRTVVCTPYEPPGTFFQFVALPDEVLQLGVETVSFIDVSKFQNPLETQLDTCVVQVSGAPPTAVPVPVFASGVLSLGRVSTEASGVVGKSIGGHVSGQGGGVTINVTSPDQTGDALFILQMGEPGDSGVLLYIKDERGAFHPLAAFAGLCSTSTPFVKRGRACLIPVATAFKSNLPVATSTEMQSVGMNAVWLEHRNGVDGFSIRYGLKNAVELLDANGEVKLHGVFVKSPIRINYTGDKDVALMSKHGAPTEGSIFPVYHF